MPTLLTLCIMGKLDWMLVLVIAGNWFPTNHLTRLVSPCTWEPKCKGADGWPCLAETPTESKPSPADCFASESGSGAVCSSLMFYKLNPWLRTHPLHVSEFGGGVICSSVMFYKLNSWFRTHPSCVSESGSRAVHSSLMFYKLNPRFTTHPS